MHLGIVFSKRPKLNKANIITVADDLLTLMGWENSQPPKLKQHQIPLQLGETETQILQFIRNKTKAGIDDIAFALQIDSGNLSLTLLDLEFNGMIRQLPGKFFELA